MSETPKFRRGAEAAQEASKSGGSFARTHFFTLDDGKSIILRFLTEYQFDDKHPELDSWITVDQHQMVPTKGKPSWWPEGANYPDRMGAVCRADPAFARMYDNCYICDHIVDGKKVRKPSARDWALACIREEVIGDGSDALGGSEMKGRVLGYRDKTREVTIPAKDGEPEKTITEKAIVVVNQGFKNFFGALKGFGERYGTILDRDYYIKREGNSTDTVYQIVPNDPIDDENGNRIDLRNPEHMKRYAHNIDLGEVVAERASDEFYAKFFDPRYVWDDKANEVKPAGSASAETPAAPENDVSEERMAELANRVKGYGPSQGEAASEDGEAEAKAGEAPAEKTSDEKAPVAAGGGMRNFD